MAASLLNTLRGAISLLLYTVNTIFWCTLMMPITLLKTLIPVRSFQEASSSLLTGIANLWIRLNNWHIQLTHSIQWEVQWEGTLSPDEWYLIICNHRSWLDILVLQKIFHKNIPLMKFFLKKELIWVPFLGIAWWALDFPFMKRYSKAYLKKHPELIGKDLEIARGACAKFMAKPVTIMNFIEGTRFTTEKHELQRSPYQHLLIPRAGGIAHVMAVMGDRIQKVIDVTIIYPEGSGDFWQFLCGKVTAIKVKVRVLPMPRELANDYSLSAQHRKRFHAWLKELWLEKDECYERLQF